MYTIPKELENRAAHALSELAEVKLSLVREEVRSELMNEQHASFKDIHHKYTDKLEKVYRKMLRETQRMAELMSVSNVELIESTIAELLGKIVKKRKTLEQIFMQNEQHEIQGFVLYKFRKDLKLNENSQLAFLKKCQHLSFKLRAIEHLKCDGFEDEMIKNEYQHITYSLTLIAEIVNGIRKVMRNRCVEIQAVELSTMMAIENAVKETLEEKHIILDGLLRTNDERIQLFKTRLARGKA